MTLGARLRRYLVRALLGLLLLLLSSTALVAWLVGSASGRATLLGGALGQVNAQIPGKLQARELARLDTGGLELRGIRVLDPTGKQVLELERLAIELDSRELLEGRIVLSELSLERGLVDLRDLAEKRRGLVAAFVDPAAPPSPPSNEPPPFVRVEQIALSRIDVLAPELPSIGQLELRALRVEASFELDEQPSAVVRSVQARVERAGQKLGSIDQLGATLAPGHELSSASLQAELAGMQLELEAEVTAPPAAGWQRSPLAGSLQLRDVSGPALAQLLQNAGLATAVNGKVALQVQALGSVEALWLRLALDSEAGEVALQAELQELRRVTLALTSRDFTLARLRAGLPDRRVSLALAGSADATKASDIPVELQLRNAWLDESALPELDLSFKLGRARQSVDELRLQLRDGSSHASLEGRAHYGEPLHGSGQLELALEPATISKWKQLADVDVSANASLHADLQLALEADQRVKAKGQVRAQGLAFEQHRVEHATLDLDVHGDPLRPVGTVTLRVDDALVGGRAVPRVALSASGGPTSYELALQAALPSATADAKLRVSRFAERVELSGEGHGHVQGQPWRLALGTTSVSLEGDVRTEGIELSLAGQGVTAQGSFGRAGGHAELRSGDVDLEALSKLLQLSPPVHGSVSLSAELAGTPSAPSVVLELAGRGLALGDKPPVDLDTRAELDSRAGMLDVALALRATRPEQGVLPLDLKLELKHRFEGGKAWSRALPNGNFDATLGIANLDAAFVGEWADLAALPVAGRVSGDVRLTGTRQDPELKTRLAAKADVLGAPLDVETQLDYQRGAATLGVAVSDARGPWLDLQAGAELANGAIDVEQLSALLPRAASDATWRVTLDARERSLDGLPGLTRGGPIPVAASAKLRATHLPGAEPELSLAVTARPTRAPAGWDDQLCQVGDVRVQLDAKLADGQLHADVTALDGASTLLASRLDAPLRLAPALSGKPPELGAIRASAEARGLPLQSLPLVCGLARGTVDAKLDLRDPLGNSPGLELELAARDFTLGAPQQANLRLRAALANGKASADAQIDAAGAVSRVRAEVPITLAQGRLALGKQAPIQADVTLRRLPIAPFLSPRSGISYASGSLDGSAEVRGTLDAPQLRGRLVLNDIAFTATDLAQPLRDVKGSIDFTQNKLILKDFEAHDQDGVLKLAGQVDFEDRKGIALGLGIVARDFPLRQQGQVVATAQIEAQVKTTLRPGQTDVNIDLGGVDLWIESTDIRTGVALDQHPDFAIDGQRHASDSEADASTKTSNASRHLTNLTLNASDRVWIKRGDFAVKLRTQLRTRIQGEEARVNGRVSVLRGYLDLMGKTFEIDKDSYLDFIGSPSPDPVLSIGAAHQNRRSGTTIGVTITGRSSAPVLTFRVDDRVVSAGDAFQAIYGSQQSNQDPNAASGQARAFVGGLTAGLLATTARRELGAAAPIIMIEPGEASGEGRIRAGFEFDTLVPKFLRSIVTGVYFEGILANESNDSSSRSASSGGKSDARVQAGFLLELYFPRNFFSAAQRGPGSTWSVDVGWQL